MAYWTQYRDASQPGQYYNANSYPYQQPYYGQPYAGSYPSQQYGPGVQSYHPPAQSYPTPAQPYQQYYYPNQSYQQQSHGNSYPTYYAGYNGYLGPGSAGHPDPAYQPWQQPSAALPTGASGETVVQALVIVPSTNYVPDPDQVAVHLNFDSLRPPSGPPTPTAVTTLDAPPPLPQRPAAEAPPLPQRPSIAVTPAATQPSPRKSAELHELCAEMGDLCKELLQAASEKTDTLTKLTAEVAEVGVILTEKIAAKKTEKLDRASKEFKGRFFNFFKVVNELSAQPRHDEELETRANGLLDLVLEDLRIFAGGEKEDHDLHDQRARTKARLGQKSRLQSSRRFNKLSGKTGVLQSTRYFKHTQIEKILAECATRKTAWIDPDFPADSSVLPANSAAVEWLRISQFCSDPKLLIDGVEPGDVLQGELGDCWFLGAASVLASMPELFYPVFNSADTTPYGAYSFNFYSLGEWHEVCVDDRIPCRNGRPIFASCLDPNETWLLLLEKALAKFFGTYSAIEGGSLALGLTLLSGGLSQTIKFQTPDTQERIKSGEFWYGLCRLGSAKAREHCVGASYYSPLPHDQRQGVMANHSYGILDVTEAEGQKLIKLRNPWGHGEWSGRFSDKSPDWTPSLRHSLEVVVADDGTFWMSFDDFSRVFDRLFVCTKHPAGGQSLVKGKWEADTAGGCANYATWRINPQYVLKVDKKGPVTIALEQSVAGNRLSAIGFHVQPVNSPERLYTCGSNMCKEPFVDSVHVLLDGVLDAGLYVIIPETFRPNEIREFALQANAAMPLEITLLPRLLSRHSIAGSWTATSAGGQRASSTFSTNPIFSLATKPGTRICAVLSQPERLLHPHVSPSLPAIAVYAFSDRELKTPVGPKTTFVIGLSTATEVSAPLTDRSR